MPGKKSASCRDATGKRLREKNQTLAAELEEQREQSASVQRDSLVEMRSRKELEQSLSDLIQIEPKLHLHVGRVGQQYSNHVVTPPNQRLLTHS